MSEVHRGGKSFSSLLSTSQQAQRKRATLLPLPSMNKLFRMIPQEVKFRSVVLF